MNIGTPNQNAQNLEYLDCLWLNKLHSNCISYGAPENPYLTKKALCHNMNQKFNKPSQLSGQFCEGITLSNVDLSSSHINPTHIGICPEEERWILGDIACIWVPPLACFRQCYIQRINFDAINMIQNWSNEWMSISGSIEIASKRFKIFSLTDEVHSLGMCDEQTKSCN